MHTFSSALLLIGIPNFLLNLYKRIKPDGTYLWSGYMLATHRAKQKKKTKTKKKKKWGMGLAKRTGTKCKDLLN